MTSQRSLRLFVRSLAPEGTGRKQTEVIDHLETLTDRGVIDSYQVEVWGDRLAHDGSVAETDTAESLRSQLSAFERWAEKRGASIEPFFERSTIDSSITGESRQITDLPTMALAEYENGQLQYLTPHETAEGVETVRDRLVTLSEQQFPTQGQPIPALD